jgi:hypothetical protein
MELFTYQLFPFLLFDAFFTFFSSNSLQIGSLLPSGLLLSSPTSGANSVRREKHQNMR